MEKYPSVDLIKDTVRLQLTSRPNTCQNEVEENTVYYLLYCMTVRRGSEKN